MGFVSAGVFLMLFLYFFVFCYSLFACFILGWLCLYLSVYFLKKREKRHRVGWVMWWRFGGIWEKTLEYTMWKKIFLSKRNSRISKLEVWGRINGLAVKRIHCFSGVPQFSVLLLGDTQLAATLDPGDLTLVTDFVGCKNTIHEQSWVRRIFENFWENSKEKCQKS